MIIDIKNLTKKYDGKFVLDIKNASLDLEGCTAVIGPNGAGKSTLVNIIAGLTEKTSGEVLYDGIKKTPKEKITLVFQKPYLISGSVEMNINYPMKLRKWDKQVMKERTDLLLEELGLTDLKLKKSWKLSGGETQKVALARALSFHPELLILDEPTANIDPITVAEIEEMLKKVRTEFNTNIIIVTHNLAQAKRVSQKAVFMNNGEITEQGDTDVVLAHPRSPETAAFIRGELLI